MNRNRTFADTFLPFTTVGVIAQAHVHRMLNDAMPEILRLAPEAQGRSDVTLFVFDPSVPVAGLPLDPRAQELVALAKGKPLTALLSTDTVLDLLRTIEEIPGVAYVLRRVTTERSPQRIPIVLSVGSTFGIAEMPAKGACAGHGLSSACTGAGETDNRQDLTLTDLLRALVGCNIEDTAPRWRDKFRRIQERGRAALSAEFNRPTARDAGEILVEAFGGARLVTAFEARGVAGAVALIDEVISERVTN